MAFSTDREKMAHALRRFGLGASESEVDFYIGSGTLKDGLDKFLAFESIPEVEFDLDRFANDKGIVNMKACQVYWYSRILTTQRPLEQALTIFWHNHFATSAEKVDAVGAMHDHVETIRLNCAGRFQDLLTAVSKDPAMLYWLDNHENKKGKPNENFAREVMELFTLGIGNYTEKDVQEAARAFTGWTYGARRGNRVVETPKPAQRPKLKEGTQPAVAFLNRPEQHDDGEKSLLGNRGNFDGDDVLGILCGNPRTAVFLTQKFWTWFVHPSPEPKVIDRIAKQFRDSGLDIRFLCRTILESPEFYSERAEKAIVKNPVSFCASTLRQLGVGSRIGDAILEVTNPNPNAAKGGGIPVLVSSTAKSMGMDLMYPPDVSGWKYGSDWITSATMVERMKWAEKLLGRFLAGRDKNQRARSLNIPVYDLTGQPSTPRELVDRLLSVFDAHLPPAKVDQLVKAAGSEITPQNANEAASIVARILFSSPEFQLC